MVSEKMGAFAHQTIRYESFRGAQIIRPVRMAREALYEGIKGSKKGKKGKKDKKDFLSFLPFLSFLLPLFPRRQTTLQSYLQVEIIRNAARPADPPS
jgi:hypothetical protein